MFPDHTLETAPEAARRPMEAAIRRLGRLPTAVARLATSPELLDGFLKLSASFEQTTLDPFARETVVMTVATRNGCEVCIELHTAKLKRLRAGEDVVAALRSQEPVPDERLEAVRQFTLAVLETAGGVDDETLRAFLGHGYTERNALEVVMGIGTYTMSTLANRLTRA
ncbi:carboxymuconolactone decarboxylase family protein [Amycolatopsis sp. QT-25]|uniref:carboxymuconolactone decarboxylase family protein n=1 Tax=Amycolatopsis sp. QT-25 TaxID=3034022 RepID=UPI0023EC999C|nr:carboxymuconolactone decarboxylase family protein [Amycolatopsis sp. QT-25]WET77644.1 carboxymuconolactone decarboxylase family protein [Amycolatopsis sp. QT-25]